MWSRDTDETTYRPEATKASGLKIFVRAAEELEEIRFPEPQVPEQGNSLYMRKSVKSSSVQVLYPHKFISKPDGYFLSPFFSSFLPFLLLVFLLSFLVLIFKKSHPSVLTS